MLVTTSYPASPGDPSGHFVEAEARALTRRGNEVTVLCPGKPGPQDPSGPRVVRLRDSGLFGWPGAIARLRERPSRLVGLGSFVMAAKHWLRQSRPVDAVVAHWLVPCGWPIALAAEAPLEVVAHGSDVRLLTRTPALARFVVRQLLSRAARFRFVSAELRDELCSVVGPELAAASRVEPAPLDLPAALSQDAARGELSIAPHARLVLIVSRLVRGKRLGTALSAVSLIPNAQVVVVGDGTLRAALEARFAGVRFVGRLPHDQALRWMAAANVLVTASRREGAPTVVREARAMGLAVVAAPAGDLAAWARDDVGLEVIRTPASPRGDELD